MELSCGDAATPRLGSGVNVSRLESENNAHLVIEAFKGVKTGHKLLIVGDAPYAHEYIQDLRTHAASDPRIIFTGFVFGESYRALQQNAYCYVHATEVGGRIRRCWKRWDMATVC